MARTLVCLGEILIDFLPIEVDGEVTGFSLHPGGGPFNVAVGLARLDQPTAFVSKVGADFFGRRLRRAVRAEGVDDRWLLDAPALSTLAFVAHEGDEPVFSFYGEGAADTLLAPGDLPDELFATAGLLHFGGISLLRGVTPTAALAAAQGLRGRALVSLDPNVRPLLVKDADAYRATLATAFASCDLLKLSAADIGWLEPGADPLAYAARQLEAGPAMVALTRGSAGVSGLRLRDGRLEQIEVPTMRVPVADTVGAGDSFTAGLLAALAVGGVLSREALVAMPADALRAALQQGVAAAAINCSRPGADPPRSAELAEFLGAGGLPATKG